MVLTGFKTPHGVASLNIVWPVLSFSKRSYELCHGLSNGIFAYLMIEFIGVTTSETKNLVRSYSKAVKKKIPLRIIFFMGSSLRLWPLFLGLILISDSPFATVFNWQGIMGSGSNQLCCLDLSSVCANSTLTQQGDTYIRLPMIRHRFLKGHQGRYPSRHNVPQMPSLPQRSWLPRCLLSMVLTHRCFRCLVSDQHRILIRCLHRMICILIMVAHLNTKSQDFMADATSCLSIACLIPNHSLFCLCFVTLFLQESTFMWGQLVLPSGSFVFGIYSQWKFRK